MADHITVTGTLLSHENQPLGGRRVVATPRPQSVVVISGETIALTASTMTENDGTFSLLVVKAPGTVYEIQTKPERRLPPGIELVCDNYPAGSVLALEDLPAPAVPTPVPGWQPRVGIPFGDGRSALTVGPGTAKYPNATGRALTIIEVRADVGIAPEGGPLVVDVHKDGTTIFTDQSHRPSIPALGDEAVDGGIDLPVFAPGEVLTVDVDAIGGTVAGGILTVTVVVEG